MLEQLEMKIVEVVEKVVPSIVSVTIEKLVETQLSDAFPVEGRGSGVILTDSGYIVTNAHVIEEGKEVQVTLNDGRTFQSEVVGESVVQDLAFLKIDAKDLVPVEVAKYKPLKVGQFAIAIGHPLGLGATITFGVVSALERTISSKKTFLEGLIQTSAQINPGNSGGALVNIEGELIGIPTAMIQWSQGIGFAIASERIQDVFNELMDAGSLKTPWMGIMGATLNKGIATHYGLPVDRGSFILEVPEGPSREAGLNAGDVIVSIDDMEIKGMQDLRAAIFKSKVGDEIIVKFYRSGDMQETRVTLDYAK
ncbi:MAG: hypothetical protein BAJATHORv1_80056 [Candidatus Thorarchaeota archaeon]|nr:MAG: hypothetical protein BAJATHORv1_80056 [Candidatus Thorarchaeota archaeon]